jgi:high-affinity iron transporter
VKLKFNFTLTRGLLGTLGLTLGCAQPTPRAAPPPDGGDSQRLVSVLDYVAGDYPLAVAEGKVLAAAEYEEQLLFMAEAGEMARALLPAAPADDPLPAAIAEAERMVRAKAEPAAVAAACRTAREAAVARFGLRTTPTDRPSLSRAEASYAQNCALCHGANGDADTERARTLDPAPASFRDAARLAELSPYRVYNALTFGVRGTGMASFASLSPAERWDLAFYVFRLGHAGAPAHGPVALSLSQMATGSDRELLAALASERAPEPAAALAWARYEAPFAEPAAAAGLDRTRRMVRQSQAAFEAGRGGEAERLALDAYLEGFEPLEPGLRTRDAAAVAAVEAAFRELRVALRSGDGARVRARADGLDDRLAALSEGKRPVVPFLAAFLIYVREGIEAALLVAALLAGLRRMGRPDAVRWVHAGWVAALVAGVATFWAFERLIALSAARRELIEALIALFAAAVLFWVSFWMISRAEARRWAGYLKGRLEASLSGRRLTLLAGLAFLAVYREAAETILFTQALLFDAPRRAPVWAGAAAGLGVVFGVAFLIVRAAGRLPLGPFFAVSSALLCALAVSFAGAGMHGLVEAGVLTPRPVPVPEVPWLGLYSDLFGLLVQLAIALVVGAVGLAALRRAEPGEAPHA